MLSDLMQYISFDKEIGSLNESCHLQKIVVGVLQKNGIPAAQYNIEFNDQECAPLREVHLDILLDNLIRNSKKFKSEKRDLFLNITVERDSSDYIFTVADNGIGIPDQYKPQIFQIFRRLNQNSSQGTGIGLSICKKIIQNYMGNIWVEDNTPHGSAFKFVLPAQNM